MVRGFSLVCLLSVAACAGSEGPSTRPGEDDDAIDTGADTDVGPPPLGVNVLVYDGDGAVPSDSGRYLINGIDDVVATYEALGAQVVVTSEWPADMSPYKLMFWYLPGAGSGGDVAADTIEGVRAWVARGGRVRRGRDHRRRQSGLRSPPPRASVRRELVRRADVGGV